MSENAISELLTMILIIMLVCLGIFVFIYIVLSIRSKNKNKEKKQTMQVSNQENKKEKAKTVENTSYNKQSIFDFMEFDSIEDNMILQKDGKRYIMVVECQGVNYDLMSQMEKIAVEEGFQQFLNTLRHPIQIYIQTRTINLESSVNTYKVKVNEIENRYNQMVFQYNKMIEAGVYSKADMDKYYFELTKQRNLLEYGKDIVANTEQMSLNKNVLNRKYYIVIPYYSEEAGDKQYDREEIKNIAFSELYTKAQSIIRTLSACSIKGKILTSNELVELLYMAYNRDDAEVLGIDKALKSQYDSLYSTSQDVFEKKMKVLDKEIEEKAVDLANYSIEKVKSRSQMAADKKQESMDELIRNLAQVILEENKAYVGANVANEAIKEIKEEGGKQDEENKKTTRGRKKQTIE